MKVEQILPSRADFSTLAELAPCCAENALASPWVPLHRDLVDPQTTSVTVFKCESPRKVYTASDPRAVSLLQRTADVAVSLDGDNAHAPSELFV